MALIFTEGFDWLDSSAVFGSGGGYSSWFGFGTLYDSYITRVTGRDGTGYAVDTLRVNCGIYKPLGAVYKTGVLGFGYQCNYASGNGPLVYLEGPGRSCAIGIRKDATGLLSIILATESGGSFFTTLATGTTVIPQDVWVYIEFKWDIAQSPNGSAEIRLNGVTECSVSAADTMYLTDEIQIISFHSYFSIDDVYFCDLTGAKNNDFLGDCTVVTIRPDADDTVAWTKSAGANNYENVDEQEADDDTTYNYSSTAAQKDLFTFGDLPSSPVSVFGVSLASVMRKEAAGIRRCKHHLNTGVNDNASPDINHLATEYTKQYYLLEYQTGTTDWDESSVNAIKAGVELI